MWCQDINSIFQMLKDKKISRSEADRMIGTFIAFETTASKILTDMNIFNNTKEMK